MKNEEVGFIGIVPCLINLKSYYIDKSKIPYDDANCINPAWDFGFATNENATVHKNVFKTRFSFALYAKIIEKNIIEINIKNSTTTSTTKSVSTPNIENFPTINIESNKLNVSNIVGE